MSLRYLYRCSNPQVVEAVEKFFAQSKELSERVHAFRDKYGAEDALYWVTFEYQFSGLVFSRHKKLPNDHLWTKPTAKGMRAPRRVKEAAELRKQWEADWPHGVVKYELFLAPLGLKQSLGGRPGIELDEVNRVVYLITSEPVTVEGTIELTTSQFINQTESIKSGKGI